MGFGRAGPESTAPRVTSRTLFRSLSLGVTLTRTLALQMIDRGQLTLDGKLVTFVPELTLDKDPDAWLQQVTIRHLLTTSSGLPTDPEWLTTGSTADSALLAWATQTFRSKDYFLFPPGRLGHWANSEPKLLAVASEKAGGTFFRAAVTRDILVPLGMDRTFFSTAEAELDGDRAWTGQAPGYGDKTEVAPLGGPYSSVADHVRFLEVFLSASKTSVLSEAMRQQAIAPLAGSSPYLDRCRQGLVWNVQNGLCAGRYYDTGWSHFEMMTGALAGWQSSLFASEEKEFGFVLLSNTGWDTWPVLKEILALAGVTGAQLQPVLAAEDPSAFSKYAGTYAVPAEAGWTTPSITISLVGSTLHMKLAPFAGDVRECDLEPLYERYFDCTTAKLISSQLHFELDASGTPEYLVTSNYVGAAVPSVEAACVDGLDNDLDGATDCVDPDCPCGAQFWCNQSVSPPSCVRRYCDPSECAEPGCEGVDCGTTVGPPWITRLCVNGECEGF